MRLVAIGAEIGARTGDGRLAAWAEVVHSDDVTGKLLGQEGSSGERNHQAHVEEPRPHYIPSFAGFFNPK